jgi:hypothetical protein
VANTADHTDDPERLPMNSQPDPDRVLVGEVAADEGVVDDDDGLYLRAVRFAELAATYQADPHRLEVGWRDDREVDRAVLVRRRLGLTLFGE